MKILQEHKTIAEQIKVLESNGLKTDSETESHLRKYGFITLAHRFGPLFQDKYGKFIPGTKFSDLYSLFLYEKQLSAVLREGLSVFEHAMKASVSNILSNRYGIFAHCDSEIFDKNRIKNKPKNFLDLKISLAKTEKLARKEFQSTTLDTENITIHMLLDSMMLFDLSIFYEYLTEEIKQEILLSLTADFVDTSKFTKKLHQMRTFRNKIDHNASIHGEITVGLFKSPCTYGRVAAILNELYATKEIIEKITKTVESEGEHDVRKET